MGGDGFVIVWRRQDHIALERVYSLSIRGAVPKTESMQSVFVLCVEQVAVVNALSGNQQLF